MDSPLVDDLDAVLDAAVTALDAVTGRDWGVQAQDLDWSVWETLEHLADDHFAYAAQIAPRRPETETYVPFDFHAVREGGPRSTVFAEPGAGNGGLVRVLDASGGLLVATALRAGAHVRGWHPFGLSDAAGFAAMGIVETLVHLYDVAGTLGFPWEPDPDVVRRTLARLFPTAPTGHEPWPTLLWATGRVDLPDRPRLIEWRWDASVP